MGRKYTPEMDAWLAENYPRKDRTVAELAFEFEKAFELPMSRSRLTCWATSRGLHRPKLFQWTDEADDFMREIIPGHSEHEIREAFEERFGATLTKSQIGNRKHKLGIKSGTVGGRFEKGHVPAQKGKSWKDQGRSAAANAASLKTAFKRGTEPLTGAKIPVGSERITKDGYVEVKVRTLSDRPCANKCWRPKHHLVWEKASGQPVPPSTMIVFADGDKRNFDPDNLVAVPRKIWAIISHGSIPYHDRETLQAAMSLARLKSGIHEAGCRNKVCIRCGATFQAKYPRQRRCARCIGRTKA